MLYSLKQLFLRCHNSFINKPNFNQANIFSAYIWDVTQSKDKSLRLFLQIIYTVDLQAEEMHSRGNLTFKNLVFHDEMSYPKYSRTEYNIDSRLNCKPKETHFPAEGHMGQMLLPLRSAHKSHDVRENENK